MANNEKWRITITSQGRAWINAKGSQKRNIHLLHALGQLMNTFSGEIKTYYDAVKSHNEKIEAESKAADAVEDEVVATEEA